MALLALFRQLNVVAARSLWAYLKAESLILLPAKPRLKWSWFATTTLPSLTVSSELWTLSIPCNRIWLGFSPKKITFKRAFKYGRSHIQARIETFLLWQVAQNGLQAWSRRPEWALDAEIANLCQTWSSERSFLNPLETLSGCIFMHN